MVKLTTLPKDLLRVALSFTYFFSLMTAYFILRPVRDEMGIQAGVEHMQWLFTGTFLGMILMIPVFGWLTRHYRKSVFIPVSYTLFLIQILLFYMLLESGLYLKYTSAIFFIWLSVFNLFVVSIFWSFMSDIFTQSDAKKYFATVAAGGTIGAIVGPSISAFLASRIGTINLLLAAAFFMLIAIVVVTILIRLSPSKTKKPRLKTDLIEGSIWSGVYLVMKSPKLMGIAGFILLYTCMSTFLYFQQAHIISDEFAAADMRTTYFALRDVGSNVLTLLLQFFITKKILNQFNLTVGLAIIPAITMIIFMALGIHPGLYVLAIGQILYRGGNFAIQKPSREILFTDVSHEERYRAKNFIDTTIYRGGDAVSGWAFSGLAALGMGLSAIAFLAVPIAFIWMLIGKSIGKPEIAPVPEVVKI